MAYYNLPENNVRDIRIAARKDNHTFRVTIPIADKLPEHISESLTHILDQHGASYHFSMEKWSPTLILNKITNPDQLLHDLHSIDLSPYQSLTEYRVENEIKNKKPESFFGRVSNFLQEQKIKATGVFFLLGGLVGEGIAKLNQNSGDRAYSISTIASSLAMIIWGDESKQLSGEERIFKNITSQLLEADGTRAACPEMDISGTGPLHTANQWLKDYNVPLQTTLSTYGLAGVTKASLAPDQRGNWFKFAQGALGTIGFSAATLFPEPGEKGFSPIKAKPLTPDQKQQLQDAGPFTRAAHQITHRSRKFGGTMAMLSNLMGYGSAIYENQRRAGKMRDITERYETIVPDHFWSLSIEEKNLYIADNKLQLGEAIESLSNDVEQYHIHERFRKAGFLSGVMISLYMAGNAFFAASSRTEEKQKPLDRSAVYAQLVNFIAEQPDMEKRALLREAVVDLLTEGWKKKLGDEKTIRHDLNRAANILNTYGYIDDSVLSTFNLGDVAVPNRDRSDAMGASPRKPAPSLATTDESRPHLGTVASTTLEPNAIT